MQKMCKCGIIQKIARPDSTRNLFLVEANTFPIENHMAMVALLNRPYCGINPSFHLNGNAI